VVPHFRCAARRHRQATKLCWLACLLLAPPLLCGATDGASASASLGLLPLRLTDVDELVHVLAREAPYTRSVGQVQVQGGLNNGVDGWLGGEGWRGRFSEA